VRQYQNVSAMNASTINRAPFGQGRVNALNNVDAANPDSLDRAASVV